MKRFPRVRPSFWLALPALVVAATTCPPRARAEVIPVAVQGGRCTFSVGASRREEFFHVVVGAIGPAGAKVRVSTRVDPRWRDDELAREESPPTPAWRQLIAGRAKAIELARGRRDCGPRAPAGEPARTRTFHVLTRDRDLGNPAHYAAVEADLCAAGRYCQVYVDRAESRAGLHATADEIVRLFDTDVYPWVSENLGRAEDVDRDGRFTILLTPLLGRMQGGQISVDGFVRGGDFDRDQAAPFGNRCDMLYLNSCLEPGPRLHAVLAHEYAHAVVYCEHVLGPHSCAAVRQDEEGWLNEGMAHFVEARLGRTWANLGHRVSAYLSAPERYPLVVPDYFHTGQWRASGTRGAAYLFVRHCERAHDDGLLAKLVQTDLCGTRNVETATGKPFARLFRDWSVGQLTAPPAAFVEEERAAGNVSPFERLAAGPRLHDLAPDGDQSFAVAATAALYLRVPASRTAATRVVIEADGDVPLQVTVVRREGPAARLVVDASPLPEANGFRVRLTAKGGDVRLRAAAWERLLATGDLTLDTSYRPGQADGLVSRWFGGDTLRDGQSVTSRDVSLPPGVDPAELVFKFLGEDAAGRPVVGWGTCGRASVTHLAGVGGGGAAVLPELP